MWWPTNKSKRKFKIQAKSNQIQPKPSQIQPKSNQIQLKSNPNQAESKPICNRNQTEIKPNPIKIVVHESQKPNPAETKPARRGIKQNPTIKANKPAKPSQALPAILRLSEAPASLHKELAAQTERSSPERARQTLGTLGPCRGPQKERVP